MVGSGTLLPDAERGSSSCHIQAGAVSLLIDAGAGTLHGLARAGLEWRSIDIIAISHYHPDHVSDLAALLAAFKYDRGDRPLTLLGPVGFAAFLERLAALYGSWILGPSRPLTVVELPPGDRWLAHDSVTSSTEREGAPPPARAIAVTAQSTPHTDESIAFRIETPLGAVGYTADTGPSEALHGFLRGVRVLVTECARTDPPAVEGHLSPASVTRLIAEAAPELTVVSHVYPPARPEELVDEIAAGVDGRVVAARDGARIVVATHGVVVDPPLKRS
ncbi:MAG: ribonuclease Z [Gemmatimonadota bacterium]|nr:ribonuclease Z [Gemmatimonadota bacterium]